MRLSLKTLGAWLVASALSIGTGAGALADETLNAKIAAANSAADHQALADYFEEEANAFEAAAKRHRGVADEYSKGRHPEDGTAQAHAAALAVGLEAAAKEASRLAELHRGLAKSMEPNWWELVAP